MTLMMAVMTLFTMVIDFDNGAGDGDRSQGYRRKKGNRQPMIMIAIYMLMIMIMMTKQAASDRLKRALVNASGRCDNSS